MKKLLVLVLILAMASIASAATIELMVNGDPYTGQDVCPSDYIIVVLDDPTIVGTSWPYPISAGATISVSLGDEATMTFPVPYSQGNSVIDVVEDGFVWTGNGSWMFTAPVSPDDPYVFRLEFHVPDGTPFSTEITVAWDLVYATSDVLVGNEVLHVVPEPMTIALLGLGGLFLRRRRS